MKITPHLTAAALIMATCSAIAAETYPARPIRMVDPFSPGGSTEAQARPIGAKLTEAWGQPVVLDARPVNPWQGVGVHCVHFADLLLQLADLGEQSAGEC